MPPRLIIEIFFVLCSTLHPALNVYLSGLTHTQRNFQFSLPCLILTERASFHEQKKALDTGSPSCPKNPLALDLGPHLAPRALWSSNGPRWFLI